jgi:hypothetical protein
LSKKKSVELAHELKVLSLDLLFVLNCVASLVTKVIDREAVFAIFCLDLAVAPFSF